MVFCSNRDCFLVFLVFLTSSSDPHCAPGSGWWNEYSVLVLAMLHVTLYTYQFTIHIHNNMTWFMYIHPLVYMYVIARG